ncbi:hypothetical protein ACROYT_G034034 [Oculina patagonica]
MSVKEKAKAFEDRHSVVGESPPTRKKSREELIGNKDGSDTLGKKHTTGPPVPPPRKYKKNGTIRPPGESSPSTERKENMQPELNPTKTTSDPDSPTRKKPPRPPPPPRGSSLGRKSSLLANMQSLPSGEKKVKPPVPPKPKNYVPKKISSPGSIVSAKNDNSRDSQPTKDRADSAPAFSTTSENHDSQFFVTLGKDSSTRNEAPPESDESRNSSQFFVSLEGKTSGDFVSADKTTNGVVNGTKNNSRSRKKGKTITSGKNLPDPLEGLEITVDAFSDEEGDLTGTVHEDETADHFSESVDVINGVTESDSTDVIMSDQLCDGFKPEDSLSEPKQNVKILYSVELEEECSVTMIDDASERQELDDISVHKPSLVSETKKEEEIADEISESSNKTDQYVEPCEETPEENESFQQEDISESYNSEPLPIVTTDEEKEKSEEIDDVNYILNEKEEDVSNFDVEKPTEDEDLCDIDILENLSDDNEEKISEDNASIEEFYKTTMDVELEGDLQGEGLDSQQNKEENQKDESTEEVVTELQQDEPQEKSEVIIAEAIREGTLISVTDHVVSEATAEVTENEHPEVVTEEDSEDAHDEVPVKETLEITASFSEDKLDTQAHFETSADGFNDQIEEQCADNIVESEPNLAVSSSEEVKSQDIVTELNEEEKSGEHLLEDAVLDSNEEVTAELTETVCSDENVDQVEADKDVEISVVEPVSVEASKDVQVVECTVTAVPVSTEEEEKENVDVASVEQERVVESQENEDAEEPHSPASPPPTRPERRNRQARQKHAYENVDLTNKLLEDVKSKSGTSVRKTHSFSSYETVVLSTPRPVQRVSDDEAIYRVPSRVIPVESYANDESVYSVPYPISSRRDIVEDNEYAVPKPIIVQACAVTDRRAADEGDIYSVPGQVTSVPVVETFADPSRNEPVHAIPQEEDNIYSVPVQEQQKTINAVPVSTEEAQQRKATTVTVSATPPPKPPRLSLTKDDMKKIKVDLGDAASSSSTDTPARESPKPVPRTREQKSSPSPVPRKSSKTAESSESATPPGGESPVPAPRIRLNALQTGKEAPSNFSSSEISSTLSSSEVSTQESTEDEATLKRKPPPRPPPPSGRTSMLNNDDSMLPPVSPGPFGNEIDSDSDSDVEEDTAPKGPPKPKTYYIAHEILTTERTFVDALKLVFEECYGTIKKANVVADAVLADKFRDLENIYLLDSKFLQELEERMETWEEHERIGDIIKKYGHFLKMYTQYVNGYDKAMSVFQDTMKENSEFATLVSQFQASERCHGMILSAYMLKPVQRIPSYRLLLIDYLKHLPKDSDETKDTETTLKIVSEVATHINESMKKMDSFEQMLKLQRMLVGHPEIVKAGRDYLKEGTLMKLCRKDMQERMFFLLTDVLLYTTPVGGNQYKLNKMLPLLGMQVLVSDSPDFVNEFSIISTTRSFTLTASTPEERDQWIEALNNAIDVVTKRKITFVNKTKDAAGLGIQEQDADFKLGEKAPVWIPDARVTMCMSCTSPFTLTNRRHHCRACGNVVCGSCSDSTAPLAYLDYTQARVCDKCYDMLLKDFHTDEIHVAEEEKTPLPPLLQETENAEKLLRKPTKFEMMRRFKSRKTKRKSQIMHPSHLTEVVANQEGSQMSGYLRYKKGRERWKKSWFVLKDNVLYSYKASSDVVALETLPVLSYKIKDLGKEGDDFVFQLEHQNVPPFIFKADNENSGTRWVRELKKAITMDT